MEDIYPPESFGSTSNTDLQKEFEKLKNALPYTFFIKESNSSEDSETNYLMGVKSMMGVDLRLKEMKALDIACSIDQLTCDIENSTAFPINIPTTINSGSKIPVKFINSNCSNTFEVVKSRKDLLKERQILDITTGNKRHFYLPLEFPSLPEESIPDLLPGFEYIISIVIYKPFALRLSGSRNNSNMLRFNHEIIALGCNTLDQIRDKIICTFDDGLCKEVETVSDDLTELEDAKKMYPSGCFFIDNTFYNDFRDPESVDYSTPVFEWAKKRNLKPMKSLIMENVALNNLMPRFGYPYLYMHQGNCEHLMIFADARLAHKNDCLHYELYPHVNRVHRTTNRRCFMCTVAFAKWICVDSDRLPQNKIFLCTSCCKSYNYIDGKKVGDFKLYPYYEKHKINDLEN